jgi:hypothetical protein
MINQYFNSVLTLEPRSSPPGDKFFSGMTRLGWDAIYWMLESWTPNTKHETQFAASLYHNAEF